MNRHKLELGVFALMFFAAVIFVYEWWQRPTTESVPAPQTNLLPQVAKPQAPASLVPLVAGKNTESIQTQPTAQAALVNSETMGKSQLSLAELLSAMDEVLQDLSNVYNVMGSAVDVYRANETLAQTYQAQIDQHQQRFNELLQQAIVLSKSAAQRFLWERVTNLGLPMEYSYLLLDGLRDPDSELLEQILLWLESGNATIDIRQTVAYNVILGATKHRERLKQFIEERLQIEPEKPLLHTYLEIYQVMNQEQGGTGNVQFRAKLELVRARLDPDQYFDYRFKMLNLADENADYAGVLDEIGRMPMTAAQRGGLLLRLSDEIVASLSTNIGADSPEVRIAANNQQTLLRYLWANLPTPRLQDSFSLYQYSSQQYAIQLLQDKAGAMENLYQKIINSQSLDEQVALLYAVPYTDGVIQKRLRQQSALRQKLSEAAKQPQLSAEQRGLIEAALSNLVVQPPENESESSVGLFDDAPGTKDSQATQTTAETPAPVP